MLKTQFPRLLGDIGNSDTFGGQVIFEQVERATVSEVVKTNSITSSIQSDFLQAAQNLEKRGAKIIGTSCGFLISIQSELQSAVSVPVITSSLTLIPEIRKHWGNDAVIGILTFDDRTLAAPAYSRYLDSNCVLSGLPRDGELFNCISNDSPSLDSERARAEVIQCATALVDSNPAVELFLIECTNLSPFNEAIRKKFGLPVIDLAVALVEYSHLPS